MFWIIFISVALIVGVALIMAQRQPVDRDMLRLDQGGTGSAYLPSRPLSDSEQLLYWRLVEALPECVVLPHVPFRSFIKPSEGKVGNPRHRALYFRVAQQPVDFLVCLKDFTVVATIHLDDSIGGERRDPTRDELLRAAGIVPLHVNAGQIPSAETLREMFTASR